MIGKERGPPRGCEPETGLTFHGQTAARDALTAAPEARSALLCRYHSAPHAGGARPRFSRRHYDSCYGCQTLCDASRGKGKAATAEVS